MSEKNLLTIHEISKKYVSKKRVPTTALQEFSLTLRENEMVAVMGNSGSGKTTLLQVLTGLLTPDSGKVMFAGQDILKMSREEATRFRRKQVGIVFQNYNLIPSLTVDENIRVPLLLNGIEEQQEKKVQKVAELLGISSELSKYPCEISGGQQQRAGIARAIIHCPQILFADEPTGNLDIKAAEQVMQYFVRACRQAHTSLLMVTHDIRSASYCDRVVFLQEGKNVAQITKQGDALTFYNAIWEAGREWIRG